MIEYLEKLVEDRQFKEALAYAESLLVRPNNSPLDILMINNAILLARCCIGENHGAIVVGKLVLELGTELEAWDYFGTGCLNLATAHMNLLQHADAVNTLKRYLSHVHRYTVASKFEAIVRYNLGLSYRAVGDKDKAALALQEALQAANRLGNHRHAHGIRQALIELYLQSGDLTAVPRLLAECTRYLRHNPDAHMIRESKLCCIKLRAEYALLTGRLNRAHLVAISGLYQSEGISPHQIEFHMLLANMANRRGSGVEALGHALAARVHAIRFRTHDLEAEALSFTYHLTKGNPQLFREMEYFYTSEESILANHQDYKLTDSL